MTSCTHWTGSISPEGYGRVRGHEYIHRVVWEEHHGPIPAGMVIDHTCHNEDPTCPGGASCLHRRCINVDHLELVTNKTNILRGRSPWAENARKTHCKRGHPLSGDNVRVRYEPNGTMMRDCKTCHRERRRKYPDGVPEKTHCPHGHVYDEANTYLDAKGWRTCKTCRRERMRGSYQRKRALRGG